MDLDQLVEKARQSTLFTAPVLGPDLERFLREQGAAMREMAKRAMDEGVRHIYWVGAGNSWVNLYSGKYLLDRFSALPGVARVEAVARHLPGLGPRRLHRARRDTGASRRPPAALERRGDAPPR